MNGQREGGKVGTRDGGKGERKEGRGSMQMCDDEERGGAGERTGCSCQFFPHFPCADTVSCSVIVLKIFVDIVVFLCAFLCDKLVHYFGDTWSNLRFTKLLFCKYFLIF